MVNNVLFSILLFFICSGQLQLCAQKKVQKIMLGVLKKNRPLALKNPSEYALEDGYLYKSTDYSVAGINVYSSNSAELASLQDKIVIVYGVVEQDLNKILVKKGKCPPDYGREQSMMQIRSDWVGAETGFQIGRSTRDKLKQVSFIRCQKIKKYLGFSLENKEKEKVQVRFRNDFSDAIQNLQLIAHYESLGKPSPMYKKHNVAKLLPGEWAQFSVAKKVREHRRHFVVRSFIVKAFSEKLTIDIDYYVKR